MFQIVSIAAAAVYESFSAICLVVFGILFTVFVINAIYKNIKNDVKDPWLKKSFQKVFIASLVSLTLLGIGVSFPRLITTITFEPIADITLVYSQSMIKTTDEKQNHFSSVISLWRYAFEPSSGRRENAASGVGRSPRARKKRTRFMASAMR